MTDPEGIRVLVRTISLEAQGIVSLTLHAEGGGELPDWEPGAHIDLVVPDGSSRQYSLSGPGSAAHRVTGGFAQPGLAGGTRGYRIAVLHEPDGSGGSTYVHGALRVGDVVTIKGPRNHFRLEDAPGYTFVAGGIGITPILPMIAAADEHGIAWHLYYYGRSSGSMAFLAEIDALGAGEHGRVTLVTADHAHPLSEAIASTPSDHLIYLCGPPRMSDEAIAIAERVGAVDRLRFELFAAPERGAQELDADVFTVRLESSGQELVIPANRTILEVVLDAGVDVMHDCAEGICGSCETKVISGTPEHRDYVLTAREKADNTCMMICVSRSSCPVLVLDL